jgi:hypothetical protein
MELTLTPDTYMPCVDDNGSYIDNIPIIKHGLFCPCGSRKDKTYDTHSIFSSHIKTKCHQNWLNNLNLNKANYYIENEELKETLQNQRIIIGKLEKDVQNKIMTIDYLTQQINKVNLNNKVVTNLIDF